MAEILFNGEGVPLMAFGKTYFATTTGSPQVIRPSRSVEELDSTESFNGYRISPWGEANDFPVRALDMIGRTGVLNTEFHPWSRGVSGPCDRIRFLGE
jgi:hypothetical protein